MIPCTQVERRKLLTTYLSTHLCGPITDGFNDTVRELFRHYYFPDIDELKYGWNDIVEVSIDYHITYNTKCFYIHLTNGYKSTVSIDRLSGKKPSQASCLRMAMRAAINEQIWEFRRAYPLNPSLPCPLIKAHELGYDAEVDHSTPFATLCAEWLKTNQTASAQYDVEKQQYIFANILAELSWQTFHKEHAQLRYLSKEGNRIAHLI